ncbi:MAG: hypothetical protein QXG86_01145 [Candidatus Woesearchaeota archaeon]
MLTEENGIYSEKKSKKNLFIDLYMPQLIYLDTILLNNGIVMSCDNAIINTKSIFCSGDINKKNIILFAHLQSSINQIKSIEEKIINNNKLNENPSLEYTSEVYSSSYNIQQEEFEDLLSKEDKKNVFKIEALTPINYLNYKVTFEKEKNSISFGPLLEYFSGDFSLATDYARAMLRNNIKIKEFSMFSVSLRSFNKLKFRPLAIELNKNYRRLYLGSFENSSLCNFIDIKFSH